MKISIVSMPVKNQDASSRFYQKAFGFRVIADNPMPGTKNRWVQLALPDSETSITLVTWFDNMPPGSQRGLVLETTDLDGDCKRLKKQRVEFDPAQDAPWARFITLEDIDGNGLVLQQRK
jgi:catechol 2,3-dioxygenase-like lactoylglutathione lyase family enzyme